MKFTLIRAPVLIASLISGALILVSLLAVLTSSPRWDDHLINAIGVLIVGVFASLTLRLTTAAFRPQPGVSKRARFISIVWLIALVLLIVIAFTIAMFINSMSFL
jgi:hypothetical protein